MYYCQLCGYLVITTSGGRVNSKSQSDWTADEWRRYNYSGLEQSNLVLVSAGTLSVALCTVCSEILIRRNNEEEADTFVLNARTYAGLIVRVLPRAFAYRAAVLIAGAQCAWGAKAAKEDRPVESTPLLAAMYHKLVKAIDTFETRYGSYCKPKVGASHTPLIDRIVQAAIATCRTHGVYIDSVANIPTAVMDADIALSVSLGEILQTTQQAHQLMNEMVEYHEDKLNFELVESPEGFVDLVRRIAYSSDDIFTHRIKAGIPSYDAIIAQRRADNPQLTN